MIDTTDNSNDSNNRVAAIFLSPDKKSFLTGKAPNKKLNDFVGKGHIEIDEGPLDALKREVYEETNLNIDDYQVFELTQVPYKKGSIYFYVIPLTAIPTNIKCNSCFEWYGRKLPEFSRFDWTALDDWKGKLYKSLEAVCEPVFEKLQSQINNGLI